ncbi:MAG: response regulator transcription factor [Phycisphaeraceae bacterium]|nr:response regulator transcription factor [Phycisphaeraceae bacterium]
MSPVAGVRIVLADHHGVVRDCLKNLIETQTDMCVVGQADSSATTVRMTRELKPHLVIMNVMMEGNDGFYATRKISQEMADARIVGLFGPLRAYFLSNMLKAGATGFVSKEYPFGELLKALDEVLAGRIYLCPTAKDVLAEEHVQDCLNSCHPSRQGLSDRERTVIRFVAEGKSVKETALALELTPKTIDACRRKLMRRLDLDSMAGLVKYALRTGLTPL